MGERIIEIGLTDPVKLYGVNDSKLTFIRQYFPKLKIVARGNTIKVIGEDADIDQLEKAIQRFIEHLNKYDTLTESNIERLLDGAEAEEVMEGSDNGKDAIVFGNGGLVVKARTANQRKLVDSCNKSDMVFAIGPAGTGKTYTAVALAVKALKDKEVRKIILTRPAVEAGENLGFLPGDLKEKLDPYLQPLYDALYDMIPPEKLNSYLENHIIQIAPLAFMRGRTLDDAFVILDEAQNATESQLKMFLTRMGASAKFVITGDLTQIDLPKHQPSGLIQASKVLKGMEGIEFVELDEKDVIRHKLVKKIVKAYDKLNKMSQAITATDFNFPKQKSVYKGKVRDVYNIDDQLLVMVVSDRISAFDVVQPKGIPFKGQVLNQLAAKFLKLTEDIVPNWVVDVPDPMVTVGRNCDPFKVEMVIRGYLAGHAWREYKAGKRELCGVAMEEGMKENQAFPGGPIITPTTKAAEGHDEDISREEILKQGIVSEEDYVQLENYTRALFQRGTEIAAEKGLILVDTKYEFGKKEGKIYLIDEIHTPDSSRYFYKEGYEERLEKGEAQKQLSKEFVREWLMENGFQGKEGQQVPVMPDEFVNEVTERYIELFEKISGDKFERAEAADVLARIESNVTSFLEQTEALV